MKLEKLTEAKLVGNVDHEPDKYNFGPVNIRVYHNRDNIEVELEKGDMIHLSLAQWKVFVKQVAAKGADLK